MQPPSAKFESSLAFNLYGLAFGDYLDVQCFVILKDTHLNFPKWASQNFISTSPIMSIGRTSRRHR